MAETPRLFKTEAIVLRHRPLAEADRIVLLLSPTHGKLEARAKGVRRPSSRMGGHLQPLTRVLVQLAQGHVRYVVAGCQTLESFPSLAAHLERLGMALYACELADRFLPLGAETYPAYNALLGCLRWLERGLAPTLALRRFEARLLRISGFGPELDHCLACGAQVQSSGGFSPQAGGVLCGPCARVQGGARPLSLGALRVLRLLQRGSEVQIRRLSLSPSLAKEVELHLRAYIAHLLEGDAHTLGFLDQMERELLAASREV